jgi:hypothetical protein
MGRRRWSSRGSWEAEVEEGAAGEIRDEVEAHSEVCYDSVHHPEDS